MTALETLNSIYDDTARPLKERREAIKAEIDEISQLKRVEVRDAQIRLLTLKIDERLAVEDLDGVKELQDEKADIGSELKNLRAKIAGLTAEDEALQREMTAIAATVIAKNFQPFRQNYFDALNHALDLLEDIHDGFKGFSSTTGGTLPTNFKDRLLPTDHLLYGPENRMLYKRFFRTGLL